MRTNPFGLPADLDEPEQPRASLLAIPGELCAAGIWMGGAHTLRGNTVLMEHAARSWFVDCAGDMPAVYRETAARWTSYVFSDIDAVPPGIEALRRLVESIVEELRSGTAGPEHLFLMCQHGMNRSGLAAGLVLGELGMPGEEAVERIVTQRPGALSNLAFRTIVLKGVRSKE